VYFIKILTKIWDRLSLKSYGHEDLYEECVPWRLGEELKQQRYFCIVQTLTILKYSTAHEATGAEFVQPSFIFSSHVTYLKYPESTLFTLPLAY
jgi:hypothetical protein